MIVCSNLGPDIAFALGFWLLDQTSVRFGACVTRSFSASLAFSTNGASRCGVSIGSSLVLETFGTGFEDVGSLTSCLSFAEKAYVRLVAVGILRVSCHTALDLAVVSIVSVIQSSAAGVCCVRSRLSFEQVDAD